MEQKNIITGIVILLIGVGAYYFLFGSKASASNVVPLTDTQAKGLTDSQITSLTLGQINAMSFDQLGLLTSGQSALIAQQKTILEAKEKANADLAKASSDAAIEKARVDALKLKMSSYTIEDMDAMTATQLSAFTTEELNYMLSDVKSRYTRDKELYAAQQAKKIGDDQFFTDLVKLTANDKAECDALASKIYADCQWTFGIIENPHAAGLWQNFMDMSLAKCYYLVNISWPKYDTRSFIKTISAQNFGFIQGWFTKRDWTSDRGITTKAAMISRINNLPTMPSNSTPASGTTQGEGGGGINILDVFSPITWLF